MFLVRMDEGSAGFTMASIDLSEVVGKATAPFESVAVSRGKRLSISIAGGVRAIAEAHGGSASACGRGNQITFTVCL